MIEAPDPDKESKYRAIFEGAPIAMWDEDFSGVKQILDSLAQSGIPDIRSHLREHPEIVMECVQRVHVRHVNRVARDFYGAETEQSLIAALPSLFDETSFEIFREEITALAEGASSFQAELSVHTLAGERRRVMMNVSLLGLKTPDWSQVVVAFTDITQRRQLEQSLKHANESLRRVNQHLEQFAYAAAHDMREPLRTIALYAQLLQRQQPPQPGSAAETALNYIMENGRRMDTLMADLLSFAGAVEPQIGATGQEETSIQAVLQEVLSSLSMAIQQSGANIDVQPDLPIADMKAVHLRQLFQNLLSNAIKYRNVDLTPSIQVSGSVAPNEITFCVADNGMGIRSEYHQQIFGIFKRLHGHEIEGNGIGLALCRKIVEDYGGRIWVESDSSHGSRFFFTVPRKEEFA